MAIMMFPRGEKRHSQHRSFFSLLAILILFPITASATEQVYYYHNDHLGSPVAITNTATPVAVVWRTDYEPFGKTTILTETAPNAHRFIGKERDLKTGLDYFGARFYDEGIGRFLSVDPIIPRNGLTIPQRHNLYSYSLNNPYRFLDPDGRELWEISRYAEVTHKQHAFTVMFPEDPWNMPGKYRGDVGPIVMSFFPSEPAYKGWGTLERDTMGRDRIEDWVQAQQIGPPPGMNLVKFEQLVANRWLSYEDDLRYDLIGGFNSNSGNHSLILGGTNIPDWSDTNPGWDNTFLFPYDLELIRLSGNDPSFPPYDTMIWGYEAVEACYAH